jgi:hypothetical protein
MSNARNLANLLGTGTQITTADIADGAFQANKNLIINGAQAVSQRNGTSSTTPSNFAYLTDRFQFRATQGSKFNAEQSTTAATGFKNSLKMTVASAYTVTSSDQFGVRQFVEGQNISHLEWGTANAKSVTLSFSVRSSVTGTHSGALGNSGDARAYPFSFTVSSADTWEQKTITIPGDTSGTWLDTNGIGIKVNFNLGAGSNHLATAGAWTTGEKVGATGAVSVVGTASATFYITGIQLELGDTATPFEHRSYGDELLRCKRYYQSYGVDDLGYPKVFLWKNGYYESSHFPFEVQLRANPTVSISGLIYRDLNDATDNSLSGQYISAEPKGFVLGSTTTNNANFYSFTVTPPITVDAEL